MIKNFQECKPTAFAQAKAATADHGALDSGRGRGVLQRAWCVASWAGQGVNLSKHHPCSGLASHSVCWGQRPLRNR